ncbi:CBS domain-containing protein [Paenochrobactrum gallinarii]|uniref:CBS domain-containing protein n=1 Tax=Paenochrobactrum gallinarii TaxID=643673 RepID=A0A841LT48_9HYPH|nr:CBS domain-containing protein [Paenochrobactrum gallinarii]MBB6259712.1 CBS domain-containing protein [Paenochrobactrum gallinarii]
MTVKSILEKKGRDVISAMPNATLSEVIAMLARHRIGALVICDEAHAILGILSERDVVRMLSAQGQKALDMPVSEVMTKKVETCQEKHTVNQVMEIMTQKRFRHMPVERDGKLEGIISIGDVVKARIEQVEREADEIRNYIASA